MAHPVRTRLFFPLRGARAVPCLALWAASACSVGDGGPGGFSSGISGGGPGLDTGADDGSGSESGPGGGSSGGLGSSGDGSTSGTDPTGDDPTSAGSTGGGSTTGTTGTSSTTGDPTSTGTGSTTTAGSGDTGNPNGDGWDTVDVGTSEDLVAVDFADAQHGWVVGTGQVLLHTGDGGATWQSQESGFWIGTTDTVQLDAHVLGNYPSWGVYHLLDVHAVSADVAWISSIGPLAAPVSLDPSNLSAVFVTADGGDSWERKTLATNFQLWGIHGFDADSARVVSIGSSTHPDSDVFQIESGVSQSSTSVSWGGLRAITFVDDSLGFMVGDDIYRTVDGGYSWQGTPAPGAFYWDVAFVSASQGHAVGEGGTIVATFDGGETWETQSAPTGEDLYGVSFADASFGAIVGDGGTVLVTSDGGTTWTPEDPGTTTWINDVDTPAPGEAWAVGDGGALLHRSP